MLTLEKYNERQQRSAKRVLDMLDRIDERVGPHHSASRTHERRTFRGQVTICLPDADEAIFKPTPANSFRVWARSLSESGMAFISVTPVDRQVVFVGVDMADGTQTWFQAEIVRSREIEDEGFHEYGVAFRARS